jgi:hypothetical protein
MQIKSESGYYYNLKNLISNPMLKNKRFNRYQIDGNKSTSSRNLSFQILGEALW